MSDDTTQDEFTDKNPQTLELGSRSIQLPTQWQKTEFGTTFSHQRGLNYSADNYVSEGEGMTFLTLNAIAPKGGLKKDSLKYYDDEIKDEKKTTKGDILIANTDLNQDGEIIGYPVRVPAFETEQEVCFSHHLLKIQQVESIYNTEFLERLLSAKYIHDRMIDFSCGSTVLNLNTGLLEKLNIPVPPLSEQRKIATVLHTVDQAIQKTEDVIESLQRILRGTRRDVMKNGTRSHQMSDSGSRFGDVPEVWDIKRLDSVTDVTGGSTPSTDESKYWNGRIPWATPTDLTGLDGIKIRDTESHITEEGLNSTSTNLLPTESVLMTSRATIGECAVNTVEMATNQGFQSLIPDEGIDTWYLYYRMQEEANYLNSLGSGSTFSEVSNTTVQRVKIPIPPIEEQEQIADTLKSIDESRIQEEEYKTQLLRLKQGLMQDLLSGTVRTTDTNIEVPDEVAQYG